MLFRLRDTINRARFALATRGILSTPPLRMQPGPATVVSFVRHADVQMYLLAAKSFYRRLGAGGVVVLADDDLGPADRDLIRAHLPAVRFVENAGIEVGRCQRGGTWERLLLCLDLSAETFVIQLDSDVLTFGEIDEVLACVAANRSFALSAEGGRVATLDETAAETPVYGHIINAACQAMPRLPGAPGLRYLLHGSSGFAGFARGAAGRALVEDFHDGMSALLGARWLEWGSEQVGSNFAVANAPDACALPWPKYANHIPGQPVERANCLHFFGTYRFQGGLFLRRARAEIAAMHRGDGPAPLARPVADAA